MKRVSLLMAILACTCLLGTLGTTPTAIAGGGEECTGDADGDGQTGVFDFLAVLSSWGADCSKDPCDADLDGDGMVFVTDLLAVLADWGCGGAQCQTPFDCDDGNDCTADFCIAGSCQNIPIPDCGGDG